MQPPVDTLHDELTRVAHDRIRAPGRAELAIALATKRSGHASAGTVRLEAPL